MSQFTIEKGIPVPEKYTELTQTLSLMEVGDSVLLPNKYSPKAHPYAKKLGISVLKRRVDETTFRLWRVK